MSEDLGKISQSPIGNIRRKHHILTPRQSERNLGISEPVPSSSKPQPKQSRFQIGGLGMCLNKFV